MIELTLWGILYLLINLLAIRVNLQYLESERQRYRLLLARLQRCELETDTLITAYEQKARETEAERHRLATTSETLIILQGVHRHLPKTGLVAIAHLMLTEVDIALIGLKEEAGEIVAEAAAGIARRWCLETLAVG
jgi:hypothetical protein